MDQERWLLRFALMVSGVMPATRNRHDGQPSRADRCVSEGEDEVELP